MNWQVLLSIGNGWTPHLISRMACVRPRNPKRIVPEEAEAVHTIFTRYLELGSMGALIAELDRQSVRTKINGRRDGGRRDHLSW